LSILTYKDLYNSRNNMLLREVFCEYNPDALLTVDKNGKDGKICLFKLYMTHAVDDPSEVTFAEEVFGDLFFWQNLTESVFFKKHAEEWRFLAATKRKQAAFKAIIEEVKNNGKSSFTAAKYLIEEPWKTGNAMERKRNKKMVSDSADIAFNESTIQSDIKRLREDGVLN